MQNVVVDLQRQRLALRKIGERRPESTSKSFNTKVGRADPEVSQ